MAALVEVRDLHVSYRDGDAWVDAVRGVSFTVEPGRVVALVGESGSGKSTIARALLGLAGPTARVRASALLLDGREATAFTQREWRTVRGRFAGLVLQDALVSLDPLRSVRREIGEAVRATGTAKGRRRVHERVLHLLASVGTDDPARRAGQHAHELSGGLRQRALIAAALAGDPPLLVADEPTTALDVGVQRQVVDLLRDLAAAGRGLLLVSHDLAVVAEVADTVVVLRDGQEVERGTPAQVLSAPRHEYTRRLVAAIPSLADPPVVRPAPPDGPPVLVATGLTVRHRVRTPQGRELFTALDDVDVVVPRGTTLGVVGPSGSGKSTLLRVLLGVQEPDAGTVHLEGVPWSGVGEATRRPLRRRVQVVAQDPLGSFDPRYRVRDILAEPLRAARPTTAERRAGVARLLADVGLAADLADRRPLELSGGQRQRVAIARALAAEPHVLLCDEAVSALDVLVQDQILDLLDRVRRERDLTMVFVSHDLAVVRRVADEILVLEHGRVVQHGPAEQVYRAALASSGSLFAVAARREQGVSGRAVADAAVALATDGPPDDVDRWARWALLDGIAALVAGLDSPQAGAAVRFVEAQAARGLAPVWGTSGRTAPSWSAFVGATAAGALDVDDGHDDGGGVHLGAATVATLLAAPEGTALPAVRRALVVGYEVGARAGHLLSSEVAGGPYRSSGGAAALGATAALAALTDPDPVRLLAAVRVAQAHGPAAALVSVGTRESVGWAAHVAWTSVGLVEAGLADESADALGHLPSGPHLFAAFTGRAGDLGRRFEGPRCYVKPYACCRATHAAVEAAGLLRDHRPAAPAGLLLELPASCAGLGLARPTTTGHAQFAAPWLVARAFLHGPDALVRLTEADLGEADVLDLAARVRLVAAGTPRPGFPAVLTATWPDGERRVAHVPVPLGDPRRPLPDEARARRARTLLGRGLAPAAADRLGEVVLTGDGPLAEVAAILRHARPGAGRRRRVT